MWNQEPQTPFHKVQKPSQYFWNSEMSAAITTWQKNHLYDFKSPLKKQEVFLSAQ